MMNYGFLLVCDKSDDGCESEWFFSSALTDTIFDRYEAMIKADWIRVRAKDGGERHFCGFCWEDMVSDGSARQFDVFSPFRVLAASSR